ncbi:hypothetical protein ACSQ67_006094 [Phaseolus vulgaris]
MKRRKIEPKKNLYARGRLGYVDLSEAGDAGLDVAVETDRVGPEPLELLRHELSISFFRRRIERPGLKAHPKPTGPTTGARTHHFTNCNTQQRH